MISNGGRTQCANNNKYFYFSCKLWPETEMCCIIMQCQLEYCNSMASETSKIDDKGMSCVGSRVCVFACELSPTLSKMWSLVTSSNNNIIYLFSFQTRSILRNWSSMTLANIESSPWNSIASHEYIAAKTIKPQYIYEMDRIPFHFRLRSHCNGAFITEQHHVASTTITYKNSVDKLTDKI